MVNTKNTGITTKMHDKTCKELKTEQLKPNIPLDKFDTEDAKNMNLSNEKKHYNSVESLLAAEEENNPPERGEASNAAKCLKTKPKLFTLNDIDEDDARLRRVVPRKVDPWPSDKPKEAVSLGTELPKMAIMELTTQQTILVIKVFSPFQFWFNIVKNSQFTLSSMIDPMNEFYTIMADKRWLITPYFTKPGFLCAVFYEHMWHRGSFVHKHDSKAEFVAIYLVDYAQCVYVERKSIYHLKKCFALQPALAVRGTLTNLYPLSSRWPADVTLEFKRHVFEQEREALIKRVDKLNDIFSLSVLIKETETTVSKALIDARMAKHSRYSGKTSLDANYRLPTFAMLETRMFPADQPELEEELDEHVSSNNFLRK